MQEGDVLLFQTTDDGEILIENGIVGMSGGLETTVFLSLFGGNEDDNGADKNKAEWWGDLNETENKYKYRSETQNLLKSLPATSNNIKRIEDAANRDLSWMIENKIASNIEIVVSMPGINKVGINIAVEAFGKESDFKYIENWKAE